MTDALEALYRESEAPAERELRARMRELADGKWDPNALRRSAERFSEERFRPGLAAVLREHGAS